MSVKIVKINDEVVRPLKDDGEEDNRPIKGASLEEELYSNTYLVGKKKSGKTMVLGKLVAGCATTDTTIIVFSATCFKDKNHIAIRKYCNKKGIPYVAFESLKDDAGVDRLDVIIKDLQAKAREENEEDSEEEEIIKPNNFILFESEEDDEEPKKRKNKYRSPEYIIILDDISNELKSETLTKLIKMNRHWKIKLIVSTQHANDMLPGAIKNCDYIFIFGKQAEDKMLKLYDDSGLDIPFNVFWQIYKNATKERFNFLYIDTTNQQLRKNFNKRYDISKELIEANDIH